jgi:hypothetical protein
MDVIEVRIARWMEQVGGVRGARASAVSVAIVLETRGRKARAARNKATKEAGASRSSLLLLKQTIKI